MSPSDFALLMQKELDANAHKGDWQAWRPSYLDLLAELHHHVNKLHLALYKQRREEIVEYAADLGNIAMAAATFASQPLPEIEEMRGILSEGERAA